MRAREKASDVYIYIDREREKERERERAREHTLHTLHTHTPHTHTQSHPEGHSDKSVSEQPKMPPLDQGPPRRRPASAKNKAGSQLAKKYAKKRHMLARLLMHEAFRYEAH